MLQHRTRLTALRDAAEFDAPADDAVIDRRELDVDACRELFFAIMQTAIRDYETVRELSSRSGLSATQRKRLRLITEESDPIEFLRSGWFEQICQLLGLDPGAVRDLLDLADPDANHARDEEEAAPAGRERACA